MKRLAIFAGAMALIVLFADALISRRQGARFVSQVGKADFLSALSERVSPGDSRQEAEVKLRGYRRLREETASDGRHIVAYEFWFGYLPPLTRSGLKFAGEVVVTYDSNWRVAESSSWEN